MAHAASKNRTEAACVDFLSFHVVCKAAAEGLFVSAGKIQQHGTRLGADDKKDLFWESGDHKTY